MPIGLPQPDPVLLLLGFGLLVVIFLLLREVVCWYWKLNRIVALLEAIQRNTAKPREPKPTAQTSTPQSKPDASDRWWPV